MQEEVNQKTVALSIRAAKLSGKVLASAFQKVLGDVKKHHQKALTPQGRQSVKKADEPLWRQKLHALCGSPKGF